ncbi:hypothetical protein SAMN05661091_2626 [Paenibacillus uliginis N3/975]|uniref:Uncharacterized protein n=1 Tax=Paenibacillus uliginis N3/975 TaxID=1313296 RepID=A0A1X7HDB0_9BACL|nr:hypothetical protein [Paenibacillus uliginis]SMF84461.1 hypothetical protein SAMN05661091_2626 [Paenibacillus uliginis N3/975]
MSDRSWKIFITFVALIVLSALVFSAIQSRTSFKALVLDQMGESQEIRSIHLMKEFHELDDLGIKITDRKTINMIMNVFADIKLRVSDSDSPIGEASYRMYIHPKNGPTFSVLFNDQNLMRIDNSISIHKKYSWTYEVVNDFDLAIIQDIYK